MQWRFRYRLNKLLLRVRDTFPCFALTDCGELRAGSWELALSEKATIGRIHGAVMIAATSAATIALCIHHVCFTTQLTTAIVEGTDMFVTILHCCGIPTFIIQIRQYDTKQHFVRLMADVGD